MKLTTLLPLTSLPVAVVISQRVSHLLLQPQHVFQIQDLLGMITAVVGTIAMMLLDHQVVELQTVFRIVVVDHIQIGARIVDHQAVTMMETTGDTMNVTPILAATQEGVEIIAVDVMIMVQATQEVETVTLIEGMNMIAVETEKDMAVVVEVGMHKDRVGVGVRTLMIETLDLQNASKDPARLVLHHDLLPLLLLSEEEGELM